MHKLIFKFFIILLSFSILFSCEDDSDENKQLSEKFDVNWMGKVEKSYVTWGHDVVSDKEGNIYLLGNAVRNAIEYAILAKFSNNGDLIWIWEDDGTEFNNASDFTINDTGIGYMTINSSSAGDNTTIVEIDLTEGMLIRKHLLGLSLTQENVRIEIDLDNNILLAGNAREINNVGYDGLVLKLNQNFDVIWTYRIQTSSLDEVSEITLDKDGNCYVTGSTEGNLDGNHENNKYFSIFVTKISFDGIPQWVTQYDERGYSDSIRLNSKNESYVVGGVMRTEALEGSVFISKISQSGDKLWTEYIDHSEYTNCRGVAVDSRDNVFISGTTEGGLNGHPGVGERDYFIAKYDHAGTLLALTVRGTNDRDEGYGINVGYDDSIFVAGYGEGSYAFVLNLQTSP